MLPAISRDTLDEVKTTIDISTPLLDEVRRRAKAEGRTVRSSVEEGLRMVLEQHAQRPKRVLRDASIGGGWLTPEYQDKSITQMIHEDYEERIDRTLKSLDDRR